MSHDNHMVHGSCVHAHTQAEATTDKPGELLEKAADQIMACFRVCVSDK